MDLLALPDELLDMVVNAEVEEHANPVDRLRLLRLVSKRFSRLHSVMRALFRNVHTIGDLDDICYLQLAPMVASGIAPYVRHVTFIPPLHAPMTYEEFKDIFRSQADWEYGCYALGARSAPGRSGVMPPRATGRPALHTEKKLKAGYTEYNAASDLSCALAVDCPSQQRDWIEMLSMFTRCTSFRFGLVDYNYIGLDLRPIRPDCITKPIEHRAGITMWCNPDKVAIIADCSFKVIVRCMNRAKCNIESFTLGQPTWHDEEGWRQTIHLDRLNLRHLRHLTVEPHLPSFGHEEDHTKMTQMMQKDIHYMFKQAAQTLETFNCRRACTLAWRGQPIALPNLRSLVIGPCDADSAYFTKWLPLLPKLEHITLDRFSMGRTFSEPEPLGNWKNVFDAMRDHGTLRKGDIDIDTGGEFAGEFSDGYTCSFDKDAEPDEEERLIMHLARGDVIWGADEADRWIGSYIAGRIEWRGLLRMAFS